MHTLVKTAFARLHALDPEDEERKLADNDGQAADGEVKLSVSASAPSTSDLVIASAEQAPEPVEISEEPKEPNNEGVRTKCNYCYNYIWSYAHTCNRRFTVCSRAPTSTHQYSRPD